jgi:uncharacterized coiled-coil protein SlyX
MTPESFREYIRYLEALLGKLQERFNQVLKRVKKLEVRNQKNSTDSNKPPASNNLYNMLKQQKIIKSKSQCQIRFLLQSFLLLFVFSEYFNCLPINYQMTSNNYIG